MLVLIIIWARVVVNNKAEMFGKLCCGGGSNCHVFVHTGRDYYDVLPLSMIMADDANENYILKISNAHHVLVHVLFTLMIAPRCYCGTLWRWIQG